jgi:hypothetical protein
MKILDIARENRWHRNNVTLLYKEAEQRICMESIDKLFDLFDSVAGSY